MPNPTTLPDVFSVGQRRSPGGTFPTTGKSGDDSFPQQNEDEKPPPYTEAPSDPCASPETALEWDADAAAAEAAKEFARKAAARQPPEDLNTREWSCYIYREADGSIQTGPVTFGEPFANGGVGTVTPSNEGIDPATIVGSVHSHSSGSHLPSTGPGPGLEDRGDIGHVISTADWITANNGNGSIFRAYIVAQNQGPANFVPYNQINVYTPDTVEAARETGTAGPEVNPEGQPCPGG